MWKLDHGQVSTLCGNLTMVKFPQTGTFSEGPTNWDILCVPACPGFLKGKIASHCIIRWPKRNLNFEIDACSSVMNRVTFFEFFRSYFSDYFYDRFIRLQGRRARDGALSFC